MHTSRPTVCLGLAAMALALAAVPAEGQIWTRIKDRARERVRETVEGAVDRTVDGVAGAVEGRARGATPTAGTGGAGTPAGTAPARTGAPAAAPAPASPARDAAPVARDTAPRAAGPVLPARAGAAQGLRDEDVAWLLPLLDAEVADAGRRGSMLAAAASGQERGRGGAILEDIQDRAQEQLRRMRSGELDPLTVLKQRVDPRYVVVPPGARYDAACSIAMTQEHQLTAGDAVRAAFTMGTEAPAGVVDDAIQATATGDARAQMESSMRMAGALAQQPAVVRALGWYQANGFTTVGRPNPTDHSFAPRQDQGAVTVTVWKANILYAPYLATITDLACKRLPSGPVIVISQPVKGVGQQFSEALASSVAGQAERVPAALRQARLTPEEWQEVLSAVAAARMDADNEAGNPGFLAVIYGERPAELARHQAAAAWFRRHQAQLAPRLDAVVARQGF